MAFGQSRDMSVSVGLSILPTSYIGTDQLSGGSAHDIQVKSGFLFAVRFDQSQGDHFGHEFHYMNSRMPIQYNYENNAQLGGAINQGGYNFLGYFNGRDSSTRVFATAGVQLTNFLRSSDSALGCVSADCTVASQPPATGGNIKFGVNYGAGVKTKLTSRYSLRFDIRQYVTGRPFNLPSSPGGVLLRTEVSVGFGIGF